MKISFRFPHTPSSNATREYRRRVLMMLCALIAVLPLAWRGPSCGHDFDFHLQSWMTAAYAWRHWILYPHWMATANYGAGEPRFVFYPPLTWMLGALLGTVMPWSWTPLVFTLLAFGGAVFCFYAMAYEWMTRDAASVAACLYVVNPYLLFVAYERAAYGELISAVWMPLLVLFALRNKPSLLPLSFIVAALWLTNAPSAVMGCYLLGGMAAVTAVVEKRTFPLGRAAGALLLGLGLSAVYLVPAWYEQRWVEIERAIGPGMRIEDSFLFGRTGEPFHDQVLRTASWIGIGLLSTALAGAIFARNKRQRLWLPMAAASALIALMLLPLSNAVWQYAPKLKFLQFPWRWLLVLALAASALIGLALREQFEEAATRGAIRTRALTMLPIALLMALLASHFFWQFCDDEDNVRAQAHTLVEGGFEGTDEYTIKSVDNGEIMQGLPLVRVLRRASAEEPEDSAGVNPRWKQDTREELNASVYGLSLHDENLSFTVDSPTAGYAVLRLVDYPAWRISVNGMRLAVRPHREDGLMTIPVTAGSSFIQVNYRTTEDAWIGRGISAASLIFVFALKRKRIG